MSPFAWKWVSFYFMLSVNTCGTFSFRSVPTGTVRARVSLQSVTPATASASRSGCDRTRWRTILTHPDLAAAAGPSLNQNCANSSVHQRVKSFLWTRPLTFGSLLWLLSYLLQGKRLSPKRQSEFEFLILSVYFLNILECKCGSECFTVTGVFVCLTFIIYMNVQGIYCLVSKNYRIVAHKILSFSSCSSSLGVKLDQ